MTTGQWRDEFGEGLKNLQTCDAGLETVERIRGRCLAALEAQWQRHYWRTSFAVTWRRWLEPAVTFTLSALYLVNAVHSSFALLR